MFRVRPSRIGRRSASFEPLERRALMSAAVDLTIADAGYTGAQKVFCGSENYSTASLKENRELGLVMATSTLVSKYNAVLTSDYAGATDWIPTA